MAGIVLAGGRSSRMGSDKALLPWDGGTLIDVVISRVSAVTGEVIVVADSNDRVLPSEGRFVTDLYPGAGPLGGIVTGLSAAGKGVHIVVACDMPGLVPALLRMLIAEAQGFDAAVPEVGGRLEPLCAAYAASGVGPLRASLESGNRAVYRALEALRLNRVPESLLRVADPGLESLRNINTRAEYEDLRGARSG